MTIQPWERSKVNFPTKYCKVKRQTGKTFVSETDLEVSQLYLKKKKGLNSFNKISVWVMELTLNTALDVKAMESVCHLTLRSKTSEETLKGESVHSAISVSRDTCKFHWNAKTKDASWPSRAQIHFE